MKLIRAKQFKEHMGRLYINPNVIMKGIKTYITNNNFDELFEFITVFVQRLYSDSHLCKSMLRNVNRTFLELISPSDIALCLHLSIMVREGGIRIRGWHKIQNPHGGEEKKVPQLFTSSKSKNGCLVRWTKEGLEYFYGRRYMQLKCFIADYALNESIWNQLILS